MIVLDTHVLIWLIEGREPLGMDARARIETARSSSGVSIPAIVPWEVGMLAKRNRLVLSLAPLAWFDLVLGTPGFRLAALDHAVAIRAAELDWTHRDPADRLIVATAQANDATLLTADEAILAYAAAGHFRAIDARL